MNVKSNTIAVLVLLLLAATLGCDAPLTPQAARLLQSGYDAYHAGENNQTIQTMDAFLLENSRTNRADEAYYLRGLAKRRMNDIDGAKADLNDSLSKSKKPKMQAKALVELGEIAYQGREMTLAENMFRQALENTERGEQPSDRARYRLGCILQIQGRWEEADVHFDRVIYFFNDSELAKLSARRTHATAWTIQTEAFIDSTRAIDQADSLIAAGLTARHRAILYDKRPLHVVQTGRYPTHEQAQAALTAAKKHSPNAFVTPTR